MPRRSSRYDSSKTLSIDEICQMYINEGVSPIESMHRARIIHRSMDSMGRQEARLWKKVREHEIPFKVGYGLEDGE